MRFFVLSPYVSNEVYSFVRTRHAPPAHHYIFTCAVLDGVLQVKDLGTGMDTGHPSGKVQLPWSEGDMHICYTLEANATLTLRASGTEVSPPEACLGSPAGYIIESTGCV